jgi:hypothetical protein
MLAGRGGSSYEYQQKMAGITTVVGILEPVLQRSLVPKKKFIAHLQTATLFSTKLILYEV